MSATTLRPAAARFRLGLSQEWLLLIGIAVLFVVVGLVNPRFVASRNLQSILLANAYVAVAAIGMSVVIISGNIDISVGSLIGVLASVSGALAVAGVPILLSWAIPVVLSILVMLLQGALVAYVRIPSIVVTLGMLSILKGGLISVTNGAWISGMPDGFHLAQWHLIDLFIPAAPGFQPVLPAALAPFKPVFDLLTMPVMFMLVLTLAAAWWMGNTAAGRSVYAVGGNAEAARLCGIPRERTLMMVFGVHGLFVGFAAVLYATQPSVIQSTTPANLELTVITASVVGGVSILGGTGTVIGSTLAAILIAAIGSALIFVNISPYWLRAAQGILILVTVLADIYRRRRRGLAR
jgi:ribose transport system permease protein/rhamnose transport system permease protein